MKNRFAQTQAAKVHTLYAAARDIVASWTTKRRDWDSAFNAWKRRAAMSIFSLEG